ncbi:siderophore-interacting protein [Algicella marina]|uniref:Siderophore-interacting protein n=1 Tax=Algicella marina TaxID=2683284 RepID=A0A6P1T093_9RHOB|nr:siderophore-interacting protein [Algicella marina]QHQ35141.1 siderophore-interacting protein [Algicella marina]
MPASVISQASYQGPLPDGLLAHLEEHIVEFGVPVQQVAGGLHVTFGTTSVDLRLGDSAIDVKISAADEIGLYQMRESVCHLLDHVFPESTGQMAWQGAELTSRRPPNFQLAQVRSVAPHGASFLRVELQCENLVALASGPMHFSLLLPPAERAAHWPEINDKGRTIWPEGRDAIHRAAYTFVSLDAASNCFTFDVFVHEGGRTTTWARSATCGETVGIMGPGGGDFPPGDTLIMAGDETALPAIRRILENSDASRRGTVYIEIGNPCDACPLKAPAGIDIHWCIRGEDSLQERLFSHPVSTSSEGVFVWVAAEQSLIREAKAHFRDKLKLDRAQCYLASYWSA